MSDFEIVTDTSTIAVFDLSALQHRVDEDGDWWTSELFDELQEELAGNNLYLIDTGVDGKFGVKVVCDSTGQTVRQLNSPSRRLFIVCGEEIPGEGLTPTCMRGGCELDVGSDVVEIAHEVDGTSVTIYLSTSN